MNGSAVDTLADNEAIDAELFKTKTVYHSIPDIKKKIKLYKKGQYKLTKNISESKVIWMHESELSLKDIYVVTHFNPQRISVLERSFNPTLNHKFW